MPARAKVESPNKSKAIPANFIKVSNLPDYFLRLPRITRRAPEINVSAATPETGLISGTAAPPAIARLDRLTKSITIPTDFIKDLLHGKFPAGAPLCAFTSCSSMTCRRSTYNALSEDVYHHQMTLVLEGPARMC
jgi:hypothetical protein